jgi:hypothetical protein
MGSKERFTRPALETEGFVGWVDFQAMKAQDKVPSSGGVYVVARMTTESPAFRKASVGGWFKGKDPTVARDALEANWVDGAEVVYIGKADQLRRRLRQFADFGTGKPIGHWGGRLIWQLTECETLLVAWRETPGQVPKDVETAMIDAFRKAYGKPPFANDPHLFGK